MWKLTNTNNLAVIFGGLAFYGQQTDQMNLFYVFAGIAIALMCVSARDREDQWERDDEVGRIERDRAADYDELIRRIDEVERND
jgi:hypothetical protein